MNMLKHATSNVAASPNRTPLAIVPAQLEDCETVIALFGALHHYNSSLDPHFALSDEWESLLRHDFCKTYQQPEKQWLLVKVGSQTVGLLIAAIHTDSPLFRHRQWVEVEALYVAPTHRGQGVAHELLNQAYAWAASKGLRRVQLYVTATNERARSVYTEQGFAITQAIMRKTLS
ncbi:MAG: GNAT family N-acetyltransferase [Anaerolineae bacterium]|nr:GNAT family N-acetyltransferase [Anaerolineae bacterium]